MSAVLLHLRVGHAAPPRILNDKDNPPPAPANGMNDACHVCYLLTCELILGMYWISAIASFYARQLYRQVLLRARISYGDSVFFCHDPVPNLAHVR